MAVVADVVAGEVAMIDRRATPAAHFAAQVYLELMFRLRVRVGLDSVMLFRETELRS